MNICDGVVEACVSWLLRQALGSEGTDGSGADATTAVMDNTAAACTEIGSGCVVRRWGAR